MFFFNYRHRRRRDRHCFRRGLVLALSRWAEAPQLSQHPFQSHASIITVHREHVRAGHGEDRNSRNLCPPRLRASLDGVARLRFLLEAIAAHPVYEEKDTQTVCYDRER